MPTGTPSIHLIFVLSIPFFLHPMQIFAIAPSVPRQKLLKHPVLVMVKVERHTRTDARRRLKAAGYTVSDYVRACLEDVAEGRIVVKRPEPPEKE
jgi:hypothetical protein